MMDNKTLGTYEINSDIIKAGGNKAIQPDIARKEDPNKMERGRRHTSTQKGGCGRHKEL